MTHKPLVFVLAFVVLFIMGMFFYDYGQTPSLNDLEYNKQVNGEEEIFSIIVTYGDGINGYLSRPLAGGNYSALVLIHEWWGLNDNIRDFADEFAREGYVVLAVDLYGGESTDDASMARKLAGLVRNNKKSAFENLNDAVKYLKNYPNVNPGALASVGWCFGGGWSYEMAKNNLGVNASVIYYGAFNPEDDLSIMRASILGHFGNNDRSISVDGVREFEANLKTISGDHQVFIYPNAGHAFANKDNESSYVPEAAELSWSRTIEFLNRVLVN